MTPMFCRVCHTSSNITPLPDDAYICARCAAEDTRRVDALVRARIVEVSTISKLYPINSVETVREFLDRFAQIKRE